MEHQDKNSAMFDLVEQWQHSGMSQISFCNSNQIKYATFNYWLKKYRQQKSFSSSPVFASVHIDKETSSQVKPRIEIELDEGVIIRVY